MLHFFQQEVSSSTFSAYHTSVQIFVAFLSIQPNNCANAGWNLALSIHLHETTTRWVRIPKIQLFGHPLLAHQGPPSTSDIVFYLIFTRCFTIATHLDQLLFDLSTMSKNLFSKKFVFLQKLEINQFKTQVSN